LLTQSGYLKPQMLIIEQGRLLADLAIPNLEVRTFFEKTVREWVNDQAGPGGLKPLLDALQAENMDALAAHLENMVKNVLSFHDTGGSEPERVYHAFMLGLLVDLRGRYEILSNRESGYGRFDIMMTPRDPADTGFVFEFKSAADQSLENLEKNAALALKQIEERDYAANMRERGVRNTRAVGVAVYGKHTHIESTLLSD
nr:PD-(D/E)XK nuclease domain-containing protein [Acidobacteriota bacterium]